MKIFSINGSVSEGANVSTLEIKSANVKIPVISVGESKRGSQLSSVAVHLTAEIMKKWESGESVTIYNAEIGQTKTGKPKIICSTSSDDTHAIVVFNTEIGFRGSNYHTGDLSPDSTEDEKKYLPFPCQVLATGVISQGEAGGMGSGEQHITVMPKDVWVRVRLGGRLYGAEGTHFYKFDGQRIICLTPEQKDILA